MLDKKDKIIFENLIHDCRASTTKLAKLTKLSQPSVVYRIKRMEEQGYITQYDLITNFTKFKGSSLFQYFVSVSKKDISKFEKAMTKIKNIISMTKILTKKIIVY